MQIGPYEIIGELARGGMAIVYRAHDPRANRTVALKLLQINDHAKRTRFLREVRSLMLLRHRYLVAAHDAGEAGGYPYLVLDLVEGESLQAQLDRETRLDPDLAVSHVRKLAEAIDYANREGVVHRDLKPENVLIDTQGEPRLTDFGLVKFTSSESLESLSKTGKMYGTPGFWSPEQAAGESDRIGPATDVYGLGATLYACLTGEAPIQGETLVELLIATRNQTPEPAGVDRKLDAICLRCLAKEPADRFASAGELNQALLDWEESPPGRELGRGPLVVLAGALGALALTLALAIGSSPATTPEQTLAAAPQESASSPAPSLPATPSPLASPTGSRDPLSAEEWMRRGVALELSLDRDRAIQAYSRAIELEPGHAQALNNRGWNRHQTGDRRAAIEDYSAALLSQPTYVKAWTNRGIARRELNEFTKALADFDRVIQLQPNKPVGYAERGVTKSRQEDYAGAKEDFDRALKLDPDDQVALAGRALALQALGKFSSSVKDIGRAIDQGPERPYQRPTRLLGVEKLAHDLVALFDQGTFSLEVLPVSGEMLRSAFASVGGVGPAPVGEALLKAWGLLARGRTGTGFCNSIVYGYRSEAAALRMVKFQRGVMGKREQLLLSIKGITSASLTFAPCPGVPEGQGFVYTQRLEQDEAVVMSYGLVVQVGRHCLQSEQTDVPKLQARAVNAKQIEILKAAR